MAGVARLAGLRRGEGTLLVHGFDDGVIGGGAAVAIALCAEGIFVSGGCGGIGFGGTGVWSGASDFVFGRCGLGLGHEVLLGTTESEMPGVWLAGRWLIGARGDEADEGAGLRVRFVILAEVVG